MSSFIRFIGIVTLILAVLAFVLGLALLADEGDTAFGILSVALPAIVGAAILIGFANIMNDVAAIRKTLSSRDESAKPPGAEMHNPTPVSEKVAGT